MSESNQKPEAVNIDDLIKAFEAVDKATSDIRMAMPMFVGRDGVVRFELTLDMAQPFMRNSADFCQKIADAKKAIASLTPPKPVSDKEAWRIVNMHHLFRFQTEANYKKTAAYRITEDWLTVCNTSSLKQESL